MASAAVSQPEGRSRFAYLDGLRGWAALLVVIDHGTNAVDLALNTGHLADSRNAWDVWLSGTPFLWFAGAGSLAVCIFFALSGFVLTHAYARSRQHWIALVARRYVRLGVPMLAGCLLGWMLLRSGLMQPRQAALLTHSSWLARQYWQQPDLLAALLEPVRLLFAGFVSPGPSYDSSLWTMPVEAIGSLILITVFLVARRSDTRSERVIAGAFCLIAILCSGSYFSLFAFGAALRLSRPAGLLQVIRRSRWALGAVLFAGMFLGTVPSNPHGWVVYAWLAHASRFIPWPSWLWSHSPTSVWHGAGAALILVAVYASPAMQAALSRPTGRFLGRISFPLYVLHVPVLMVVECQALLLCHAIGIPALPAAVLSSGVFVAAAIAVAAMLTPSIEGGAIRLSARVGNAVDSQLTRLLDRRVQHSGPRRGSAIVPEPVALRSTDPRPAQRPE